jgi:antitoxin MazE
MRVELVRIGNSRGIRIPRALIEQCGFGSAVELTVRENRLTIAPERSARQGWREAFLRGGPAGADDPAFEMLPSNEFDKAEWEW